MVRVAGDRQPMLPANMLALRRGSARQLLTVTVVLRRANQGAFERYLSGVENPSSPLHNRYLTQSQLANRFGPSLSTYDQVRSWLASEGFKPIQVSANRLSLIVRGTRADAERAFDTPIRDFRVGKRAVYANVQAPAVPGSLSPDVQAVMGLSDVAEPMLPAPHYVKVTNQCTNGVCSVSVTACFNGQCFNETENVNLSEQFGDCLKVIQNAAKYLFATKALPAALAATLLNAIACNVPWGLMSTGSGCLSAGKPPNGVPPCPPGAAADFRRLARQRSPVLRPRTPGQWPKIGLLEFDTFNSSDVGDWLSAVGLDSASQLSRLSETPVAGGVGAPGSGEGEVLLDIDTVLAGTAPTNAPVVVYDAPANTSFVQMFQTMIGDGDTVISNSWAQCEDQTPIAEAKAIDSVLASAAASGVSVLNGAGDTGSTCLDGSANTVAVPADSPNATAVGGSTLVPGPGGTYGTENWWDGSGDSPPTGQGGFGVSRDFAAPAYQSGLSTASGRSVPDLVAPANPIMGPEICEADAGGCPDNLQWGGTSMAAPEWASIVADLDSQLGEDVGDVNAALYPLANTSAFHTAGDLGSDFAHVGLGDANYPQLLRALAHYTPEAADPSVSVATATGTSGPDQTDVPADGKTTGTVLVDLRDANGFPISGKQVTLTPQAGSSAVVSPSSATTDATGGTAVFQVTDTAPETVTFTVTDASDGVALTTDPTLTFVTPAATGASIAASPANVVNDGGSQATITVYLQNALGRPAAGKTVSLSDNGAGASVTPASLQATTGSDGVATFTATDLTSETVRFTATDVSDGNLPVPGSAAVSFGPAGPPACGETLPTGSGGFSVSPFASGLGSNQQAVVSNVGLTFTTPACDGAEVPVFDASGNVYVPDDIDGHIYRFGPSGGTAGPANALPDTNFAPSDGLDSIAFGKNGELWAAANATDGNNSEPRLLELDPTTGATERVVVTHADGFNYCPQYNMAVDPLSGDVFAGDDCGGSLSSDAITRVHDPDSSSPSVSNYVTEAGPVVGLTFAPDGTMFVVTCVGSACEQIDSITGTNSGAPTITSDIATLPKSAVGIAVASHDAGGRATALYVADDGGDVYRIDLTQSPATLTRIASGGGGTTGNLENQAVGAGPDGCAYVARGDTVYKVSGSGCSQASAGPEIVLAENGLSNPPTGSAVGFTATLENFPSASGTPVHFNISGPNPQTRLADANGTGQADASYSGVFAGIDTITASAVVNGTTLTSAPVQVHWVAGKATAFLSLNPSQPGGIIGQPATISAALMDVTQTPAAPIVGQAVTLALGGQTCIATTNGSGLASCSLTPRAAGLLTVGASYGGTGAYTTASDTNVFDAFGAVAPRITRLHLSARKFRAASGGATIHAVLLPTGYARSARAQPTKKTKSKHPKPKPVTATVITYQDSLPATTTFTVLKPLPGIRKGHRCVAPPKQKRKHHAKQTHCTRYKVLGHFAHNDVPGTRLTPISGVKKGKRCVAPPVHPAKGRKYKRCARYVQTGNTLHFSGRLNGRKLRPGTYRLQASASIDGQTSKPLTVSFTIVR